MSAGKSGLPIAYNPKPGQSIIFRFGGEWVRGVVAVAEGTELRLPVRRIMSTGKPSNRIYWRNRTQIFEGRV